jgi:hypothetical protein
LLLNRQQALWVGAAVAVVAVIWTANGFWMPALGRQGKAAFWAADVAQWIVLPGAFVVLLAQRAGIRPAHYGFTRPSGHAMQVAGETAGVLLTAGLAFVLVRSIAWWLLDQPKPAFSLGWVFPAERPWRTFVWLYASITAGVVESAFFIGLPWLLYQGEGPRASRTLFTLATSAVFAAAHWEQGLHVVAAAFVSHLVLCFWFFQFGNLWQVAGGHTCIDLLAFA